MHGLGTASRLLREISQKHSFARNFRDKHVKCIVNSPCTIPPLSAGICRTYSKGFHSPPRTMQAFYAERRLRHVRVQTICHEHCVVTLCRSTMIHIGGLGIAASLDKYTERPHINEHLFHATIGNLFSHECLRLKLPYVPVQSWVRRAKLWCSIPRHGRTPSIRIASSAL